MDPRLRAGDTDREHVAETLQRHTAAGRLTLDEYEQRVSAAWQARTLGDLAALTADLPTTAPGRGGARPGVPVLAALTALVALLVVAGVLAATGAAGWAHMGSMMATMGSMPGCR